LSAQRFSSQEILVHSSNLGERLKGSGFGYQIFQEQSHTLDSLAFAVVNSVLCRLVSLLLTKQRHSWIATQEADTTSESTIYKETTLLDLSTYPSAVIGEPFASFPRALFGTRHVVQEDENEVDRSLLCPIQAKAVCRATAAGLVFSLLHLCPR